MTSLGPKAGRGWHWICALCVASLLGLFAMGGYACRVWQFERRGVERASGRVAERRPGINVELAQYDAGGDGGFELDAALADLSSLGFYWLRQRFPWRAIEPAPGVYDWDRWDAVVEAVKRHNLGLIAVLEAPPEWAMLHSRFPLPCEPPCRADAYARFVSAFARRYGSVIDHYQVWDEPNLGRSWGGGHVHACGYVALLGAAYPALHDADPGAWVLGGGLAPTQAPGPEDLNDLVYLEHLYALGGRAFIDVLAVKSYGFWSGPEDRRIAPDVLNYSRVIALREQQRLFAGADVPIWAVEWGWNVLPEGWAGEQPPWGNDTIAVQAPRIRNAVARARAEWPWMGVQCWAEYQPDIPSSAPRWGFALRDGDGDATALYLVLREVNGAGGPGRLGAQTGQGSVDRPMMPLWSSALLSLVAVVDGAVLWRRCACGAALRHLWRRWSSFSWRYHLVALLVLALLVVVTPWPEWIALELSLAALVLYNHPRWAVWGAVFCIPFFYVTKTVALGARVLDIPPAELWLWLALVVAGARWARSVGLRGTRRAFWASISPAGARGSVLGALWVFWVALGAVSPLIAPDPALAWREWRLTMLDPMLLYFLLRSGEAWNSEEWLRDSLLPQPALRRPPSTSRGVAEGPVLRPTLWWGRRTGVLLAWVASGVVVALVGVGQWVAGAWVQVGGVGRVTGVYYSPNHLALYLERIWPLVLAVALHGGLVRRWRLAAWGGVAVLGLGLYLTYSRAAWLLAVPLALLVIAVAYWTEYRRAGPSQTSRNFTRRWWATGALVLAVLLAAAGVLLGRSTPGSTLLDEVRIPVWQSTLEMIAGHPWRGVGLDGFRFVYPRYLRVEAWTEPLLYHPHNMWLDAAVRLGLPGLAAFAVLVTWIVREVRLFRARRAALCDRLNCDWGDARFHKAVAVGCLAGVCAGLAHGLVDSGYFVVDLAWSLALVAGLLSGPRRPAST